MEVVRYECETLWWRPKTVSRFVSIPGLHGQTPWLRDTTHAVLTNIIAPCSTDLICFHPKLSCYWAEPGTSKTFAETVPCLCDKPLCHPMNWATLMMLVGWPIWKKKHSQLSPKQRSMYDLNVSRSLWDRGGKSTREGQWVSMIFRWFCSHDASRLRQTVTDLRGVLLFF